VTLLSGRTLAGTVYGRIICHTKGLLSLPSIYGIVPLYSYSCSSTFGQYINPGCKLNHVLYRAITLVVQLRPQIELHRRPNRLQPPCRLMGNCCGSTVTVPPSPSPQLTERTIPVPVPPQPSAEMSPVPSSRPPFRSRSRAAPKPEPTHDSGMSARGSNFRSRTKSTPLLSQSSKSTSPQNPRARAETLPAPERSNRPDARPPMPGEGDTKRAMNPQ
jgi:hypothetical protein